MTDFRLKILAPGSADVVLDSASGEIPWPIVKALDRAGIRVICAPAAAALRTDLASLFAGSSGLVAVGPRRALGDGTAHLPCWESRDAEGPAFDDFVNGVVEAHVTRPYAFFVGRLERDFAHARAAIRSAVERVAGIPLLWADDGRHVTNVESVRRATQAMIRHAAFVVADLTLGVESPDRENPSRAHEIGLALAYERPLLLTSQEPRRYPYFSIADMQMLFWLDEGELAEQVGDWIVKTRPVAERRVLNHELTAPLIARPTFRYDASLRYVGPRTPRRSARGFLRSLLDRS